MGWVRVERLDPIFHLIFSADGWRFIAPLGWIPHRGKISASAHIEGPHQTRYWNAICASKPGRGIAAGNRSLEDGWAHSWRSENKCNGPEKTYGRSCEPKPYSFFSI